MTERVQRSLIVCALAILACTKPGTAPRTDTEVLLRDLDRGDSGVGIVEWPVSGGDPGGTRYSPLSDVNKATVGRLTAAWIWHTGEGPRQTEDGKSRVEPGSFQATPVMIHDTLYLSTPYSRAVALDATTGRELWSYDPGAYRWAMPRERGAFVHRGVAVWKGEAGRRVFLTSRWQLIALDAGTGRPISTFGDGGAVDLTVGLQWPVDRLRIRNSSPPVVVDDRVIVGGAVSDNLIYRQDPPGDVQAFDAVTGRRIWVWSPIPAAGEPGSETWQDGSNLVTGHTNVWAPITVDTARRLVFLPVSTPSNDWYGGARKGDNLFAESLVCLDARTGRRVWHFQITHHGLWDYDPAAPPVLVTLQLGARRVDAVVLVSKNGFTYVFDRVTGQPIWPIEERAVPSSDVPGEQSSPTQPFPSRPAPFATQGFTLDDVVAFTPEVRELAIRSLRGYRLGPLFTPPSREGTVVMPGWIGGAGWGAASVDPESGTLYVKATNRPILARLVEPPSPSPTRQGRFVLDHPDGPDFILDLALPNRTGPLAFLGGSSRIPVNRPPYGTLTAIDLNSGDRKWQVTLGDTPAIRRHPRLRDLNLPLLGVAGAPGATVTGGGLLFATGGGRVLYALDRETGSVLWQSDLGSEGYSNPMTYRTTQGRQFIVVAAGRSDHARLMAFALATTPGH